ncbi:copper amine oxidase N-terminal domain-containing protein [Calidifontibacillus oryziterrae]|uniref:copper amine oxidase N-terminal domain-containing protein n=1 Tax=Calidifontibacillus oryziterrae TaxID=1191699 RepID=UPI0003107DCF|nr:copper amine oxidase N-terminal domain-containing protein [Calidifontibacillus oryziterrae]
MFMRKTFTVVVSLILLMLPSLSSYAANEEVSSKLVNIEKYESSKSTLVKKVSDSAISEASEQSLNRKESASSVHTSGNDESAPLSDKTSANEEGASIVHTSANGEGASSENTGRNDSSLNSEGDKSTLNNESVPPQIKELILIVDSQQMYNNGVLIMAPEKIIIKDDATYVPAKAVSQELGATVTYDARTKTIIAKKGDFTLTFKENAKSYTINEDTFQTAQAVAYTEKDIAFVQAKILAKAFGESIQQIEKNKVVITYGPAIIIPNDPPVAKFETDKDSYKIGEPIQYQDFSTDDKEIVESVWTNKEPAFFEAGDVTITLKVKDKEGLTNTASKTITIDEEIMYTEKEFGLTFAPIGGKIKGLGREILEFPEIEPNDSKQGGAPLVRINSPERITGELVHYTQTLEGSYRFTIHKQNALKSNVNLYFTAHNPTNEVARIKVTKLGVGGPALYLYQIGKAAVGNYLLAVQKPNSFEIVLQPGETKPILPKKYQTLAPNYSLTAYADIYSNVPVTYTVASLLPTSSLEKIPSLPVAARDGNHNRGVFTYSDKEKTINRLVGEKEERLIIGDGTIDTYQIGYDDLSKEEQINKGNRGVLYTVTFNKVAPNTIITVNARGGQYAGAFSVNGNVVHAVENGLLTNPAEAAVLHRTGEEEERVKIQFIPASGSNLPINIVFFKALEDEDKN